MESLVEVRFLFPKRNRKRKRSESHGIVSESHFWNCGVWKHDGSARFLNLKDYKLSYMESLVEVRFLFPKRNRKRKRSESHGIVSESHFWNCGVWKHDGSARFVGGSVDGRRSEA
ncbi:hypothetical protein F2Q69_00008749 [Brassica cretica]|uniref:Uncharacterized protein n=3 Tax=Brassica TaxID=3705 RepID=A0A8S9PAV9_BRACR|nr:hypothetical protein F2Q69_00008749 [Brassica cretica]